MALKIDNATNNAQYAITKHRAGYTGEVELKPKIFKEVIRVVKDSFAQDLSQGHLQKMIYGSSLLLVVSRADTNVKVGVASLSYEDKECYFSCAAIVKSERGNGLYYVMNRLRIKDGLSRGYTAFTVLTQNPKVERSIARAMETLREEGLIAGHDVKRELIRKCYRRMLTDEVPKSSDERINNAFSVINYKKGDAFQITFSVKPRTLRSFFSF